MGLDGTARLGHQPRWMMFVDGENLTIRAQRLREAQGRLPFVQGAFWEPDTSAKGDDDALTRYREALWQIGFDPLVFKKSKKAEKAKGVDIALSKDLLSHAFHDNYDACGPCSWRSRLLAAR